MQSKSVANFSPLRATAATTVPTFLQAAIFYNSYAMVRQPVRGIISNTLKQCTHKITCVWKFSVVVARAGGF